MKQPTAKMCSRQSGVALVVSLLVLVLLAVMSVALLQSSGLDRGSSKGVADKARADLIAQTAVNAAIAQLRDSIDRYPDSQTGWERVTDANGQLQYEGTILYYRTQTPETLNTTLSQPAPTATPPLYILPLISGALAKPTPTPTSGNNEQARIDALRLSLSTLDDSNSYNFNRARTSGDLQGWIGSSPQWPTTIPAPTTPQPFRGQWVTLTDSQSSSTGRYAFWIEDESFKANANLMGNVPRGSDTLGESSTQIPFQSLLKNVLGNTDPDPTAKDVVDFRATYPGGRLFNYRDLNRVVNQSSLAEKLKFEATIYSGANNLSRSGTRRANLNKLVRNSTDRTEIRTDLDQIIKTITYHLPNFAQRFYRNASDLNAANVVEVSGKPYRTIYLNKLAANIHDYIDTDSQPTVINNDGDPFSNPPTPYSVRIGPTPAGATWKTPPTNCLGAKGGGTSGLNEVIAVGKERVPFIQEYVLRVKQLTLSPRTGTFANYEINIDHYVEFWNPTNRDVLVSDLGPNPYLLIANQPGWDANGLDDIPAGSSRDIKIPLSDVVESSGSSPPHLTSFPAGSVTVITSDPSLLPALTPNQSRIFFAPVPNSLRDYKGKTQKKSGSQLRLNLLTRTTSSSDYETELVLGNDLGVLESGFGAAALTSAMSINADTGPDNRFDTSQFHFQGSSLRGNIGATKPFATSGDPRTNADQVSVDLNGASANNDKTRYVDSGLDSKNIPGKSSLGAPNTIFTDPTAWSDYSSNNQAGQSAPGVISNAPLTSIVELGNVIDPARGIGDSNDVGLSRGGGRTLRVGQPDDLWDKDGGSPSRDWAAWRLADVFTSNDYLQFDARININGLNRDSGAAFQATLYGFAYRNSPDSDPAIAGQVLTDDQIADLVAQMKLRLNNQSNFNKTSGPFTEFGELSELPFFNSQNSAHGPDMRTVDDRAREEILRRLSELITTRGNTFTVYAVGQSLVPKATGTASISATSQVKVTFRLDPIWRNGSPADPFDPDKATTRFAKPDYYAVKILNVGD